MTPICPNSSDPSIVNEPVCTSRRLVCALLIITTIGALIAAGLGLGGFGTQQGWWSAGMLSHLSQTNSMILMGSGGGIAGIALIGFIIALVRRPKQQVDEPITASSTLGPVDSPQIQTNKPPTISPEQMRQGLQAWIEQAPLQERRGRQKASEEILRCFESGSKSLSLTNKRLTTLPPEIGQLSQLTELDLHDNQLTSLPPQICQLTRLDWLNLAHNQLTSLPPEIGQLAQLKELSLQYNRLTSLPPEIGQLTQLKELSLFGNQLTTLPPEIGQLTQLTMLHLHDNQLTSLLPEIGQLTQLKELNLFGNQLTSLPPEIGQLNQLKELNLFGNQLTSLPPEIGQLNQLTGLNLGHNQLTSLPENILSLPARLTIDLSRNPLSQRVLNNLREMINAPNYHGPRIHFSIHEERNSDDRSLEELLQELSTAAGTGPITLTHLAEHAENVRIWLLRLSAIGDYSNKRQELALLIYNAIAKADTEDGFRDSFLSCIQEAASTCGDRMALSLLYLGIHYKIAQALAVRDLGQLAYLLGHGSWALDQLGEIAKAKARSLRFVDEVEVYLAYPVMLKNKLKLPIDIDTMLYFGCSSVTEEDLSTAAEVVKSFLSNLDSYCEYLAKDATWQKALESDSRYILLLKTRNSAADYEAAYRQFQDELKALTQQVLQKAGYPPFLGPSKSSWHEIHAR